MKLFPLMLDVSSRLAVVIGGGPVGMRKARSLLDAGAFVRLVTLKPPILKGDFPAERFTLLIEKYKAAHLDDASLVFAAATSEVNAKIARDAESRGVWINCAEFPEAGDFVVPAVARRGDLVIAVSTGGAAPALARRVRDQLDSQFDDAWADWVAILGELRDVVRCAIRNPELRRETYEQLSDPKLLEKLRLEGQEAARMAMRQVVEEMGRR